MTTFRRRKNRRHPKLQELLIQYAGDVDINGPEAYRKYLEVASDPSWKLGVQKRSSFLARFYEIRRNQFGVRGIRNQYTESKPKVYQTKEYEYKIFGIPIFSKRVRSNV